MKAPSGVDESHFFRPERGEREFGVTSKDRRTLAFLRREARSGMGSFVTNDDNSEAVALGPLAGYGRRSRWYSS